MNIYQVEKELFDDTNHDHEMKQNKVFHRLNEMFRARWLRGAHLATFLVRFIRRSIRKECLIKQKNKLTIFFPLLVDLSV